MKTNLLLLTMLVLGWFVVSLLAPPGSAQQQSAFEQPPVEDLAQDEGTAETTDEASSENAQEGPSFWMEQKLRLSKDLLAGLATADFEAIGKSAEIMNGLNRMEKFVRRNPEGYRDQLKQFNMANKALMRASRNENLEAATLAFNQMTISCVSCHQSLREATLQ